MNKNNKPRLALYARVSKGDEQNPLNQLRELRQWAKNSGTKIFGEFVDRVSSRDRRPEKEEVLRLLRIGSATGVAFWSLDRWGRNMDELVLEFEEAIRSGWKIVSLKEGLNFDTAAGRLYANLMAAFANFERERIRERTMAGLARARSLGVRLGRPPNNPPPPNLRKLPTRIAT